MSILMVNEYADFNMLKELLGATDGNLASHTKALEKAEYIAVKKKMSKSQKKILENKEPEFLSDETKEGWLIDQKNI